MADELTAPLSRRPKGRFAKVRVPVPEIIAGALALFLACFVGWSFVAHDPLGGEPIAVVPVPPAAVASAKASLATGGAPATSAPAGPDRYDGPVPAKPRTGAAAGTTTVNIINGMTGARQQVTIPAPTPAPAAGGSAKPPPPSIAPVDQKFLEMTPLGALPRISADGVRPADAFAQPVKPLPGRPDAPRIAIIVSGLGVSAKETGEAVASLPGPVTLAFIPYGVDAASVARARHGGHEVLLEVPMEPFNYPENDPGPQTLLTSLAPPQNLERLHWLMSRFQGYVGLINMMGARFTASEQAFAPVLQEVGKRGLIYVDDGESPRSVAGRIAGANGLPYARADVDIDAVPTPERIDRALGRLEMIAKERHVAVGIASALPVSITHIAQWARAAASRGILLVPITAVAMREKQT